MVTMSALLLPLLASAALLPAASSLAPCATAARCSGRAAALGYDFDPGTGGTVKGCVLRTADGTVRWTDGGAGEVATSDLPGGYERVYCEDEEGEEGGEDALPPIFNEPPEANDGGAVPPGTAGGEEAVAPAAASEPADSDATATSESAGSNATAADGGEASTSGEPAAAAPEDEGPAPVVRPCISLSTCRLASQSLGLAFATVGGGDAANATRGCFGEGDGVHWNDGEVYEEASMDLPPGRSRVHCSDGPDGTVVGSLVVVGPCLTRESCEAAAGTRYSFSEVTANGTRTKGCFRKNDAVYWSPGADEEMSDEDLPGVRRRVYCREDVSPAAEAGEAKLHGPFAFTSKKNGTGTDGEDGEADATAGDGAGGAAGDAAAVGGDGGGSAPPASGAVPARGTGLLVAVMAAATAV